MIKSRPIPQNPSTELILSKEKSQISHSFKISITSLDNASKECSVSVESNSFIVKSQSILDRVDVLGKNLELKLPYKHKIWLEVLFDANRIPVLGLIKTGIKWDATVKSSSGDSQKIYPNCEEFISRSDITDKTVEVDRLISYIDTLKESSDKELDFQVESGLITKQQYDDAVKLSNPTFEKYKTILKEYKASMSKFFVSSPSQSWKKLFRLYYLIGYTTKDLKGAFGSRAYFSNEGSSSSPQVAQTSKTNDYKIVQCANSDLILQDSWYNSTYPSKILVPYSRAVHPFFDGQNMEEPK
jgi:hypothetical protein